MNMNKNLEPKAQPFTVYSITLALTCSELLTIGARPLGGILTPHMHLDWNFDLHNNNGHGWLRFIDEHG